MSDRRKDSNLNKNNNPSQEKLENPDVTETIRDAEAEATSRISEASILKTTALETNVMEKSPLEETVVASPATEVPSEQQNSNELMLIGKTRLLPAPETTRQLLTGPVILLHLHNEHRYIHTQLSVLDEQITAMETGLSPDYSVMIDVVDSIKNTLEHSHFPRKEPIYRTLAQVDKSYQKTISAITKEQMDLTKETRTIYNDLKNIINEDSTGNLKSDSVKKIKTECEHFLANVQDYIDREENNLCPLVAELFAEQHWKSIATQVQTSLKKKIAQRNDRRDLSMSDYLSRRLGKASNDFTLLSFVSLSAFGEGVGAYSANSEVIHNILKKKSKQVFRKEVNAYRGVWEQSRYKPKEYLKVYKDAIQDLYDTYTESANEISEIIGHAKGEIAEPYNSQIKLYHKMTYKKEADRRSHRR